MPLPTSLLARPVIAQLAEAAHLGVLVQEVDGSLLWASTEAVRELGCASLEELRLRWSTRGPSLLLEGEGQRGHWRLVPELASKSGEDSQQRILLLEKQDPGLADAGHCLASHARLLAVCLRVPIHDLRTPLNTIALNVELARRNLNELSSSADAAEVHRCLETIASSVDCLDKGLRGLLAPVRPASTGRGQAEIGDVVDRVVALARPVAAQGGVSLGVERPAGPLPVAVEAPLVHLCIAEVVLNGLEATPRSGSISLRVVRDGSAIAVTCSDTGPGIPGEIAGRIWEKGFTTKEGRSGLGLYLSRKIARHHGGSVEVDPRAGIPGASFRITLPQAR